MGALEDGDALLQRKAVMQQVIEEVQVTDRQNIRPISKVPVVSSSLGIFRPLYGSVPPEGFEPSLQGF